MNLDEVERRMAPAREYGTRLRIFPGDGDHRHGTENGYHNLGCRCSECREAIRLAQRKRIERRSKA